VADSVVELARRFEEAAADLPGIRRARVEYKGESMLVRALVAPERTDDLAIAVLRDLARRLEIDLPTASIEILRVGEAEADGEHRRRRLMSLTSERVDDRFMVRVVLELAGDLIVGESEGMAKSRRAEQELVVEAVVDGLSELLDFKPVVEAVDLLTTGTTEVCIVALDSPRGTMTGAARLKLDEHDAIARATLDALNRPALRPVQPGR
jgi:hypothetical protein